MSYNKSMIKSSLDKITLETFREAIFLCYKDGITSVAPLGFSGDTVLIYAKDGVPRQSQVSIRNYSNDAELLITDLKGGFVFYGRLSVSLGLEFVAFEYFRIFRKVKDRIPAILPTRPDFSKCEIGDNALPTIGFKMLEAYQKSML